MSKQPELEIGQEVYFLKKHTTIGKEEFFNIVKTKVDGYLVEKSGITYSVESDNEYREKELLHDNLNDVIQLLVLDITKKL